MDEKDKMSFLKNDIVMRVLVYNIKMIDSAIGILVQSVDLFNIDDRIMKNKDGHKVKKSPKYAIE